MTVGNLVQGGAGAASTLTTIVTMDPIYCYFDVPEEAFLRYRNVGSAQSSPGQTNPPLACELALASEEGFPHKGRVDFFDNQVDAKTGTIRVRGVFANADRALGAGNVRQGSHPGRPA